MYRSSFIVLLFFTTIITLIANSHTYKECTETIKENALELNSGTVQFEYIHYSKFWLYRSVVAEVKVSESETSEAEPSDENESSSLVTILDVEMYPTTAKYENSYLWSWKLRGTLWLNIPVIVSC